MAAAPLVCFANAHAFNPMGYQGSPLPDRRIEKAVQRSLPELRVGSDAGKFQRIGPAAVCALLHAPEVAPKLRPPA